MIQLTSKPNVKTLPSLLGVVILSALYCIFILKTGDSDGITKVKVIPIENGGAIEADSLLDRFLTNTSYKHHREGDKDRLRVLHKQHNAHKDTLQDARISCSDCLSVSCQSAVDIYAVPKTLGSTSIESGAFKGCPNISTVIIGSTVTTIGEEAFSDSANLWKVSISSSAKAISKSAFRGCSSLRAVSFPADSALEDIGPASFSGCASLRDITIPNGVASIGAEAFSSTGLISVYLPEQLTTIGVGAFSNCTSLQAVEFPASTVSVGGAAFTRDPSLHCLSGIMPRVYPSNTFQGSVNSFDTCNPAAPSTLLCQFGSGCSSDGDCVAGNKCYIQNAFYSQCVPDSSVYANSSETQCLANHAAKCDVTADCCDPGAYCDLKATFSQCKQPTPPNCLSSRSSTSQPVLSPTRSPIGASSAIPTISPTSSLVLQRRICQYGGYCRKDGDCVAGNKCNVVNQYYSQCIPDNTQYLNSTTCLSNYGGQCSAGSICCDPGASCDSRKFSQCAQPQTPDCLQPDGFLDQYNSPTPAPTLSVEPTAPTNPLLSDLNPICQYGGYCGADSDCVAGNMCWRQNPYYSQCIPDPSQYLRDSCLGTYAGRCTVNTLCCDPGARCDNDNFFPQCSQPVSPSCSLPDEFRSSPTSSPVRTPSAAPATVTGSTPAPQTGSHQSPPLICQYGGYCLADSDCVAGNKCSIQSPFYSQCIPDPSQFRSDGSCVANYGSECSDSTVCCDPGAKCGGGSYRQCAQPTAPDCSLPTGYKPKLSPTGAPVVVPTTQQSEHPSSAPSIGATTEAPTVAPSAGNVGQVSQQPVGTTISPSAAPSDSFIGQVPDTESPTAAPDIGQTAGATIVPTSAPSASFIGEADTESPTSAPDIGQAAGETIVPTSAPSVGTVPQQSGSESPSSAPSQPPVISFGTTESPSFEPSTISSTLNLTLSPSESSQLPTEAPSQLPTTAMPSEVPSLIPSFQATSFPSSNIPSNLPSHDPTENPSMRPTSSSVPSTLGPSADPTASPSGPSQSPTEAPSQIPTTAIPSVMPTKSPSTAPENIPIESSSGPSQSPTEVPSQVPTTAGPTGWPHPSPSMVPTFTPTGTPSVRPSNIPSAAPSTPAPSAGPTSNPSGPSPVPTDAPSQAPITANPTVLPTANPSTAPVYVPTESPSSSPSALSSSGPTTVPTLMPSESPLSRTPTVLQTTAPSIVLSTLVTSTPSDAPVQGLIAASPPSAAPILSPSALPSRISPTFISTSKSPSYTENPTIPSSLPTVNPTPSTTISPILRGQTSTAAPVSSNTQSVSPSKQPSTVPRPEVTGIIFESLVQLSNYTVSATTLDSTGQEVLAVSLAKAFNVDVDNVQYIGVTSSLTRRKLSGSSPDSGTDKQLINVVKVMVPINSKSYANFIGNPDGLYANLTVTAQTPEFNEGLEKTVRLNSVATPLTQSEIVTPNIVVKYVATINMQYTYPQPSASPTQGSYVQASSNAGSGSNNMMTIQIAVSLVAFVLFMAVVICIVFNYRRRKQSSDELIDKRSRSTEDNKSNDEDPLVNTDGIYSDIQSFSFDSNVGSNESSSIQSHLKKKKIKKPSEKSALSTTIQQDTVSSPIVEQEWRAPNQVVEQISDGTKNNRVSDHYYAHQGFSKTESDLVFTNPFRNKKGKNANYSPSKDLHNPSDNTIQTDESFILPFGFGDDETKIVFDKKKVGKSIKF